MPGLVKAPTLPADDGWTDEEMIAKLRNLPVVEQGAVAGYGIMVLAREVHLLRAEMKAVRDDLHALAVAVRMR